MRIELWKTLLAAALVAFTLLAYRRTFPPVSGARRALLAALRAGAFVLLGLLVINPSFVSKRTDVRRPVVVALLDHSRSMGIRDSSGKTRLEDALGGVAALRRAFAGGSADVETVPFAGTVASGPIRPDSAVTADGEGTDIWGALEGVQRRYRSRNLAAVILLSDGMVTRGMVTSGEGITVPVYAVGFGDTLGKADVSIDEVIAERIAYKGTKTSVEAVLRASGVRGRTLAVRLLEGGKVRSASSVVARKDAEIISVPLSYTADVEGEHRLSVEVLPVAGEEQRENNTESFRLNVLKGKVRILYIDQFPDWNTTFVRDLVKRSERLEVETVSWAEGKGFVASPDGRPWTFPASAAALERYDLVIVSDDAKLFNASPNAAVLEAFVRSGKSALFLADENSPLGREESFGVLAPLLPVRRVQSPRVEYAESFVKPSPEAFSDPVSSMLAEDRGLEAMPPLPARIAGLAATSSARVPLILDDRKGGTPFLVIARCGEGLTGVVLGFPVWRWKLAGDEGERIYESFFGGLVQYLAEGAKVSALAVDADRTVYRAGDPIKLTAYIGERRSPEGIRGRVLQRTGGRDTPVSAILFEPDSKREGYYRATVSPVPPGEYVVTASEVTESGGGISGATSFSVTPVSVEFLNTSRNAAVLAEVARTTRGAYLEGPALGALAARLHPVEQRVERKDVHDMRGNILILIGIVALLGVEWILRKGWGLV
ncbi:MAG: hypothetical protein ABR899_11625 [Candidatus Krumholzibacteriaceae bacterium]